MKLGIMLTIFLVFFICSITFVSADNGGGGTIRVDTVDLTEQSNDYSITPRRLKFEFNDEWYAIRLRRVKDEYAAFIIMKLDENNLNSIIASTNIENEFNLGPKESREIDLNSDNINDIIIELNKIIKGGTYGTIRSASFSIRKLTDIGVIPTSEENEIIEETKINEEEIIPNENKDVSNEESQEEIITTTLAVADIEKIIPIEIQTSKNKVELTFFQKIVNWFKWLF